MKQFFTFLINNQMYGVEINKVLGVVRDVPIIRVPLANQFVKGLIHFRGQIISVINLRKILDIPERESNSPPGEHAIIRSKLGSVSFLVDELKDIEEISRNARFEMPKSLQSVNSFFISQIIRVEEAQLYILDSEKVADLRVD